ncbi:hypothetical protein IF1G_10798 [Cordyceps javanica]|uniref:Uncharacterized protein n=1 Tax=Cordyceps javanica TaxID=43265 RepID=A0A545ULY1_9HYPO|nr:hypothetical protein IF1G_10798 [Cordyceps javanica]TQW01854.1 hypothetical protein IF2G_10567 [Cordyceps javanica]
MRARQKRRRFPRRRHTAPLGPVLTDTVAADESSQSGSDSPNARQDISSQSLPERESCSENSPTETHMVEQTDTDASQGRSSSVDEPLDKGTQYAGQPPFPESRHAQSSDCSQVHESETKSGLASAIADQGSAVAAPPLVEAQTDEPGKDATVSEAWWLDTKRAVKQTPPPPLATQPPPAQQPSPQPLPPQTPPLQTPPLQPFPPHTDPQGSLQYSATQNGPHDRGLRSPMPIPLLSSAKAHRTTYQPKSGTNTRTTLESPGSKGSGVAPVGYPPQRKSGAFTKTCEQARSVGKRARRRRRAAAAWQKKSQPQRTQVGGQASHGVNRESLLDLISLVNTLRGRSLYRSNGQMPPGPPASVNHPAVTKIPRPLPLQKLRPGYAFPTAVSASMSAPLPGDGPHVGYHHTMDPVQCQPRREATVHAGLASRSMPTVPTTISYAEAQPPHLPPHQTSALHPNYDIYAGHVSANPSHHRIVDMNGGHQVVLGADR